MKKIYSWHFFYIKFIFTLLLCVSFSFTFAVTTIDLPDLGGNEAPALQEYQEYQMGREFIQLVRANLPLLNDPIITDYIQHLGFQLVSHSPHPEQHFYFFVVRDADINAFAGPDGYIGINTGLIEKTRSESELASVLAHEISHVTQHHLLRSLEQQKSLMLVNMAALLASMVVGIKNPALAESVLLSGAAGSIQKTLSFSREYEQEADRIGINTLYRSGFDPNSMPLFFEHLARESQLDGSNIPEFLQTHPVTESRLADAKNRAAQYPRKKSPSSQEFAIIQGRILADLHRKDPKAFARELATELQTDPASIKLRYAYALALAHGQNLQAAATEIQTLQKRYPDQIIFTMTLASIQNSSGQVATAKNNLEKLYKYHSNYYPLIMYYASFLLDNQKPSEALSILDAHQKDYAEDIPYLALRAQAEGKSKRLVAAYRTRAKIFQLLDNPRKAVEQLTVALQFAKNDPFATKQLNNQIEEIKRDYAKSFPHQQNQH